jgi:sugar-specific transcriptional regulator TrmB
LEITQSNISTFVNLGLTPNQAKIYLALTNLGKANAKQIWKSSGVSREEVYRKLTELQKMGFVETNLSKPKMFTSLLPKDTIKILLHRKAEEISNLQYESEKFLKQIEKEQKLENTTKEYETIVVPKKHAHIEKARQELLKLEKSLDCILSWNKCSGWFSIHNEIFKQLLKKNVLIRWVVEKDNASNFLKKIENMPNNHFFKVKFIKNSPESCLGIYDKKVILLDTSAISGFIETPMLWLNNPSLVVLAQSYFDKMWNNSKKTRRITID